MASSSTSSVQKRFKYDVFLSFSGEDVRKNFIDHLYFALQQKNIYSYKDDERIKKGRRINGEFIKAIKESKFYIIVFSKNYASSSWCLDELVKIMECHKAVEHTAYPVFYDVEPTEVRKQSGVVGKAFAKYTTKKAARKWKTALKEAADLAGWELKNTANGHEAEFIRNIVDEISRELRFVNSSIDVNLIGMESRVRDVVLSLKTGVDNVRIIGIKGMGGGGKTTLARAVFDQISIEFEGKSFVENITEQSKPSLSGLKSLQKQVLSDILNDQGITISSVHDGKNMMKKIMSGRKVLLVLDDVDNVEQPEALAGDCNWFKPGSRIIITTRDEQVLLAHNVDCISDVSLFSKEEAICLLSRYAFGRNIPLLGYEELSSQVVHYAAGLPLTIKVLGSFLCGKDELHWKDALERLKTIPLKATLEKLELSYMGLKQDYKEIFLDVACILKGEQQDKAIQVLESCGFHARNGLMVLKQKSLITISKYGNLGMHDHIEEMARNIVRRSHPDDCNRHSRLWIGNEIEDILESDQVNQVIRCEKLCPQRLSLKTVMRGLENIKKLRVLYMCSRYSWKDSDEVSQHFPNALQYLSWRAYPFSSLHITFQPENLVGLDMSFSSIVQLWDAGKRKVFHKLRFLDLSYTKLRRLNLGLTPNLEILNLKQCTDLMELHIPGGCPKLKFLCVDYSPKLRKLDLGLTPYIETLSLVGCDLEELHMAFRCPKLKSLSIDNSKLRKLELLTPDLEKLNLGGCSDLIELQFPAGCPKLKFLSLSNSKLRTLDLGLTQNLERLDLKDCLNLVDLKAPVGCLEKLLYLDLSGCGRFKSFLFDKCFESLEVGSLSELRLIAESIDICPLHPNNSLPKFRFTCVYKEDAAASSYGNLEKLVSTGLCACTSLDWLSRSICSLQCLRKLTLEGSITEAPKDLYRLECLNELNLFNTKIKHLPESVCRLKELKYLTLRNCRNLENLPYNLGRLESLEELFLSSTDISDLPDSICKLKNLKSLTLKSCLLLQYLPHNLSRLRCLEELRLTKCRKLWYIPGIKGMERGYFERLIVLDTSGTAIDHPGVTIFRVKGLRAKLRLRLENSIYLLRRKIIMYSLLRRARTITRR